MSHLSIPAAFVSLLLWAGPAPKQTPQFYTYWFSPDQRKALDDVAATNNEQPTRYFVQVGKDKVEYTECEKGRNTPPVGRFRFSLYRRVAVVSGQFCKPW